MKILAFTEFWLLANNLLSSYFVDTISFYKSNKTYPKESK